MRGMTGHGRGEAQADGLRVTADVRTVNHRFLDCEVRGPLPPDAEAAVRALVESRLSRGRVEVHVALDSGAGEAPAFRVNLAVMRAVADGLAALAAERGVRDELRLEHLAALPWARAVESAAFALTPVQQQAVLAAVSAALDGVVAMREREGRDVGRDVAARLAAVRAHLGVVRDESRDAPAAHAERLRTRVAELAGGVGLDPQRLAQEIALLADKGDVSEEIARLESHLAQIHESLDVPGPAGKRLDFTLQEAFREVNTIGSKSRSTTIAARVIEMKSELERMREQAANLE